MSEDFERQASQDFKPNEAWVNIQQKTFTKWMNSHLVKKGFPPIQDAQNDFESGEKLMFLINSLYDIPLPKYNKNPKMRPHKLDNITLALNMVEEAHVKTNFLKSVHLADKDLKMILGMVWAIILDFQIKGISVEEFSAKDGLLLWCQKKTAGYRDVKVENFTNSWVNGLAFCALIHRHRPDLLDFEPLDKNNNKQNLELAFDVAEKKLGIPRLLDIEDLVDVAKPDERSIMTYVSEYFHCFAAQGLKELAARRVKKFAQFNKSMEDMQEDYQNQALELLQWISNIIQLLNDRNFEDSSEAAKELFNSHRAYLSAEKPVRCAQKLDLEALYANIQTKLSVYSRHPYVVPEGLSSEDLDIAWENLEKAEKSRGVAVRDHMFKFMTKATSSLSEEQIKEFEASFRHFDKDGSEFLDMPEFKAALVALGIPFKNDDELKRVFNLVSEGNPKISKQQFVNYLISIAEDKDTPDQIKESFKELADESSSISTAQLRIHPLEDPEINYLGERMPHAGETTFDYRGYTDSVFKL